MEPTDTEKLIADFFDEVQRRIDSPHSSAAHKAFLLKRWPVLILAAAMNPERFAKRIHQFLIVQCFKE